MAQGSSGMVSTASNGSERSRALTPISGIRTRIWHALTDVLVLFAANGAIAASNRHAVGRFVYAHRRIPRLAVPRTYAERMLWRKLVDHNPQFVMLSDKLACKEYVARTCPDLATPETLWIGKDADEIPDHLLQGDVFLKTTHGYNFNHAVRNGVVDRVHLKARTDRWLGKRHGLRHHEWAYSQVEPRLFVEQSIGDAEDDLLEFNIRASDGQPLLGSVVGHNKLPNQWTVYLDLDGRPTCGPDSDPAGPVAQLPAGIDIAVPYRQALAHVARLSPGIDYARYDFMWNGRTLYAGEITIYPSGGNKEIAHPEARRLLTDGWRLEASAFLSRPQQGWRGVYAAALRRRLQRH